MLILLAEFPTFWWLNSSNFLIFNQCWSGDQHCFRESALNHRRFLSRENWNFSAERHQCSAALLGTSFEIYTSRWEFQNVISSQKWLKRMKWSLKRHSCYLRTTNFPNFFQNGSKNSNFTQISWNNIKSFFHKTVKCCWKFEPYKFFYLSSTEKLKNTFIFFMHWSVRNMINSSFVHFYWQIGLKIRIMFLKIEVCLPGLKSKR